MGRRLNYRAKLLLASLLTGCLVASISFGVPKKEAIMEVVPEPNFAELTEPVLNSEPELNMEPKLTWREGSFKSKVPFYKQLRRQGLSANQVQSLVDLLTPVYDFRRSSPRHEWRLGFEAETAKHFTLQVSPIKIYDVENLDTEPILKQREIDTFVRQEVIRGTLEVSLFGSLDHAPKSTQLASMFTHVFAWDIDFHQDPRKGDRFELLAEMRYVNGEGGPVLVDYERILAARYYGADQVYEAVYYKPEKGEAGYYNAKGYSLIRDVLRSPLKVTRVTSSFRGKRYHPVLKRYRAHNGVDYGALKNTPVMAVASGRVVRAGRYGGAGIAVVLKHKNRLVTQYFHLNKIAKGVRKGRKVKQGQVIGYVGKTGLASGYHLHFGMKKNGKYVNPLRQKYQPGVPIRKVEMARFQERAIVYLERLDKASLRQAEPVVKAVAFFEDLGSRVAP